MLTQIDVLVRLSLVRLVPPLEPPSLVSVSLVLVLSSLS